MSEDLKKAYVVKRMFDNRPAICCSSDIESKEIYWVVYIDNKMEKNVAEILYDKFVELDRNNYKVEFLEDRVNVETLEEEPEV